MTSTTHPIALGIDGGATGLKWCVRAGGAFHEGEVAGANRQLVGPERFQEVLRGAIAAAASAAGCDPRAIRTAGLGLAGVDRPGDVQPLRDWLRVELPALERCWVGNDALPALRAGADRLQGIVLIAGTGSICYGADGAGRVVRTGGWGGLFGDEGSGFAIGRAALQAVAQSSDGRRAPTVLIDHVLEHLGLHEPDELIPWAYGLPPERQKSAVAALAPVVFAAVETGCDPARKIVEAAATDLRRHIEAVLVMLGSSLPRPTAVVLSGGVLRPESPLARLLEADIAREGLPVRPIRADISAARGALHLGEEIGS